jgi:hypothetical protein
MEDIEKNATPKPTPMPEPIRDALRNACSKMPSGELVDCHKLSELVQEELRITAAYRAHAIEEPELYKFQVNEGKQSILFADFLVITDEFHSSDNFAVLHVDIYFVRIENSITQLGNKSKVIQDTASCDRTYLLDRIKKFRKEKFPIEDSRFKHHGYLVTVNPLLCGEVLTQGEPFDVRCFDL